MQHQPTNFDAIQIIRDNLMAPVSVHREKRRMVRAEPKVSGLKRKSLHGTSIETFSA